MKNIPAKYTIVLDKYDDKMRTIYDALDELKGLMSSPEYTKLHVMFRDGTIDGTDLEERVSMTYYDFGSLMEGVAETYRSERAYE